MIHNIAQIADHARNAQAISSHSEQLASDGGQVILGVVDGMSRIAEAVDLHRLRRGLEVVVGQADGAGGHVAFRRPVPEMFLFILMVAIVALEGPVADRRMRQNVVGQHQRVAADRVAEVKADAVPLHLAAGEIQIGFAVLHRIFQGRIIL